MEQKINQWIEDWIYKSSHIVYENQFNEKSTEWIEIENVGRFQGLYVISDFDKNNNKISITLKYDKFQEL